jgi:hypothetical protein
MNLGTPKAANAEPDKLQDQLEASKIMPVYGW